MYSFNKLIPNSEDLERLLRISKDAYSLWIYLSESKGNELNTDILLSFEELQKIK